MAKNLLQPDAAKDALGWEPFTVRREVDVARGVARGALVLEGSGRKDCIGGWKRHVRVTAGRHYRLTATASVDSIDDPLYHVWARVFWNGMGNASLRGPDSIRATVQGKRVIFGGGVRAPEWAESAEVLLMLRWAPRGKVRFSSVALEAAPKPTPRPVTLSTVYWRPSERSSIENNVANFLRMIDRAAGAKPDVVVLPEALTAVGVSVEDPDALFHAVPGPVFDRFAAAAKRHKVNLAFSLFERSGRSRHVGAYLVDRRGRLIGRYYKTHCPVGEDTSGIMTGDSLPVFETDFARVAFQICMETAFPEMTRSYVLDGAEIILMPSWNAGVINVRARAMENGVYCVVSGFDVPSMVVGPDGEVIASTWKDEGDGVATATVDLSARLLGPYVGNFPEYMARMRRPDLYGRLARR